MSSKCISSISLYIPIPVISPPTTVLQYAYYPGAKVVGISIDKYPSDEEYTSIIAITTLRKLTYLGDMTALKLPEKSLVSNSNLQVLKICNSIINFRELNVIFNSSIKVLILDNCVVYGIPQDVPRNTPSSCNVVVMNGCSESDQADIEKRFRCKVFKTCEEIDKDSNDNKVILSILKKAEGTIIYMKK